MAYIFSSIFTTVEKITIQWIKLSDFRATGPRIVKLILIRSKDITAPGQIVFDHLEKNQFN
jgi:hypothetical protein